MIRLLTATRQIIPGTVVGLCGLAFATSNVAADATAPAGDALAREILTEIIAIDTTSESGNTIAVAQILADRLIAAGVPSQDVQILGPRPDLGNLVVKIRGSDPTLGAVLLMGHIDVVGVIENEWSVPPYALTEKDGFLYGRGVWDNKGGISNVVSNLIRLRREGFVPKHDLIVLATADEETTQESINWLLTEKRSLIDAEFALNTDGAKIIEKEGRPIAFMFEPSEKVYLNHRLVVHTTGGHSSLPTDSNAIYILAAGLARLGEHRFPENLNEVTAAYFEKFPATDGPYSNALQRTTCVATVIHAGHAENALPQRAEAIVNCRMLPNESVAYVEATLREVLADDRIVMTRTWEPLLSPASPLDSAAVRLIERIAAEVFPGVPVVPEMAPGASDGAFTRTAGIPTYTVSAVALDPDDDRAHGKDERLSVRSYSDSVQFWYQLLKAL